MNDVEPDEEIIERLEGPEAQQARAEVTENPFKMPPDEIAMWLGGGALPGSVKHEQAKAALEWELNQRLREGDRNDRRWVVVGAIAALIAAIGSVIAAIASLR